MQIGPASPLGLTEPSTARADVATSSAAFARLLQLAKDGTSAQPKPPDRPTAPIRAPGAAIPLQVPPSRHVLGAADRPFGPGGGPARRIAVTPPPERDGDDKARDAAEQLVSVVLVEPILKRLRESSQAAPPFAPTNGEKQFRSMLDAKLAHRITSAAHFPLVDRLARDLRSPLRTEAQLTPAARA